MITIERLGVRPDGNPVIETSTYVPANPEHPLAVTLDSHDGFWVRVAVGNSLAHTQAKEVTPVEFNAAVSEIREMVEIRHLEAEQAREVIEAELTAKKEAVKTELANLGLSPTTVEAILDQVRG